MSNPAYWNSGDIPWISSKEVAGGVLVATEKRITSLAVQETSLRLLPPGSVVVVVRSGILLHTFPVAFVPFECTVNQDVKSASAVTGVDGRFLAYLIEGNSEEILQRYRKTGTTVQSVDMPGLLSHRVSLPPLPVQRRIVDLMAHLDNQIANLRTERDAVEGDLRRIRNGLMLSGEPRRAGDVFEILIGRQRSPSRSSGPSMTPYLRAANVKDGRLDLSDVKEMDFDSVERDRFGLKSGDVLVSEGSGSAKAVGAAARWTGEIQGPICFQNTLLRYREVPGESVASFVYHWCRWAYESGAYMETATGTNILHIGSTRAVEMSVGWQAPGTQVLLCEVLDDHETTIVALDHEVQSLTKVREVMLADLLAGRLVVHERYDSLLDGVA
jgi:hypothetical protein